MKIQQLAGQESVSSNLYYELSKNLLIGSGKFGGHLVKGILLQSEEIWPIHRENLGIGPRNRGIGPRKFGHWSKKICSLIKELLSIDPEKFRQ